SYWPVFFEQGQLVTVAGWLQALPRDAFAEDWPLCLAAANVMTHLHRLDEAERWLELAATAPQDLRDGHDPAGPIPSQRAGLRLFRGDVGGAIASARDALAAPSEPAGWRVVAQLVLGASLWWAGEASEATAVLDQAVKIAETAGSRM